MTPEQRLNSTLGRPKLHGAYARRLPPSMRDAADEMSELIGSVDQEVTLSRAILADLIQKMQEDPTGGVEVGRTEEDGGTGRKHRVVRKRPYLELVAEAVDRVTRAELARGKVDEMARQDSGDDEPVEAIRIELVAGYDDVGIEEGEEDLRALLQIGE